MSLHVYQMALLTLFSGNENPLRDEMKLNYVFVHDLNVYHVTFVRNKSTLKHFFRDICQIATCRIIN